MPMLKASFARYARDSGKIAGAEVEGWFADIDRAVASGSFMFVLPQFVVRGIRSQAPGNNANISLGKNR